MTGLPRTKISLCAEYIGYFMLGVGCRHVFEHLITNNKKPKPLSFDEYRRITMNK